jgi:acyl-CoA dehydrogenase
MDFAFDSRTERLRAELLAFMDSHVYPAEARIHQADPQYGASQDPHTWATSPVMEELKGAARERGLWNFFHELPNLGYAPLAEITGWSPALAPEAVNCSAPDTGNMEVLSQFGTEEQKDRWLKPLLAGRIRSAFAMTEPDVASSDATNIETRIRREGEEYVIDGRKWYISGAMNPNCRIFIVMGKTDPDAARHRQQSMVLVPRDTPGLEVVRPMHVFGYRDEWHGGHAEVRFTGVRVPAANIIAGEGKGFAISQARLGPGRIHHCMRLIGMAERGLAAMCARVDSRVAFGRPLSEQGVVRDWIAESRVRIEQARLLVLKTAWLMDTVGNKGAHTEIQAIKIAVPSMTEWVLDKAIQAHGGGGVGQDFGLAELWAGTRTLRLADGPDEVHRRSLAKAELARQAKARGSAG